MLARLACGFLLMGVSACSSFDFGDAISTAAVFAEAHEIKECRASARESGDRWALAACDRASGW